MEKKSEIFVAGHESLVGASLIKLLKEKGFVNAISKSFAELEQMSQKEIYNFLIKEKIEYIFMPTVKEGGILANTTYPADLIYTNLKLQLNLIHAAFEAKIKKLLFIGSSCTYPKACLQPIKEDYLLTGSLEHTNEAYAIAKIAGIKMCQAYNQQHKTNFISVIPANVFGPGDDFDPKNSHVVSALIQKFHEAKIGNKDEVILWGTGKPRRDFIFVDDVADACIFLMENYDKSEVINVGASNDISIGELAKTVKDVTGYSGSIKFDISKPDGMPRKALDSSHLLNLGWKPKVDIKQGLKLTYDWYLRELNGK